MRTVPSSHLPPLSLHATRSSSATTCDELLCLGSAQDTFFVVLKCFQRASSCREVLLVVLPLLATLNSEILLDLLGPFLLRLLAAARPISAMSDDALVACNSVACAIECARAARESQSAPPPRTAWGLQPPNAAHVAPPSLPPLSHPSDTTPRATRPPRARRYAAQLAAAVRAAAADGFGAHAPLPDCGALTEGAVSEIEAFGAELGGHLHAAVGELAEGLLPTAWLLLDWQVASYLVEPTRGGGGGGGGSGAGGERTPGRAADEGEADDDGAQPADARGGGGGSSAPLELPAAQMVRPLAAQLEALRERLAPAAHAAAVEELARRLAARMEDGILTKRFNELGAIQLQAEVCASCVLAESDTRPCTHPPAHCAPPMHAAPDPRRSAAAALT